MFSVLENLWIMDYLYIINNVILQLLKETEVNK